MNTLDRIKVLGCSNSTKIMMAYQTYLELTTVEQEHYTDVTYLYDDELDIVYLEGWKNSSQSTFVPIHSSFTLSLNWLRTVRSKLCRNEEKRYRSSMGIIACRNGLYVLGWRFYSWFKRMRTIILVIRDADSSCVHYKLSEGLIMPPVTSNRSLRKGSEKSRKKRKVSDQTIAMMID